MSGEGNGQEPGRGEISPEDREAIRPRSQDIAEMDAGNQTKRSMPRRTAAGRCIGRSLPLRRRNSWWRCRGWRLNWARSLDLYVGLGTMVDGFVCCSGLCGGHPECDPRGTEGSGSANAPLQKGLRHLSRTTKKKKITRGSPWLLKATATIIVRSPSSRSKRSMI